VPALHLLLQEKVRGTVAKTIFCMGETRDRMLAAQRCARWLTRFHSVAPRSGRIFALSAHLRALDVWAHQIAKLGAPVADQARRLVEGVDSAAAALDCIAGCAGHGSYSPAHVIFTPGRTVVFDWDGYDVADPTRDVARFIVGLQRLALGRLGSIRALDAAAEVFEQTYSTVGRPEVVVRLPVYKAATCLQLAVYTVHHQVPQWRHKVEAMLGEGLRILEQQT
jgi:aminoglycoside phosphotransferase (APT) family kinase protein